MKTSTQLFLLGALSALSSAALADGAGATAPAPVDTSQWKCEGCKFEQGVSGTLDVGAASVSANSPKFGDYTGLNKDGAYFIGDGTARYRGDGGAYWNLNASNLGLKSRSLDMEGGRQGKYKLLLRYDELPHFVSDNALTPFSGSGGATLSLPAGFAAGTTGAMPLQNLQRVEIGTQRKRLGVGASWIPASDWEYAINFRHETKDGTKRSAGSFFVDTSQLIEPVEYDTDQLDASASYTGKRLQLKFAYYGSTFKNSNSSLTWQNPYATPGFLLAFPNGSAGQLALPPGNQFHQVLASAGYQISERTRASADLAFGRMTQNDSFLQYGTAVAGPGGSLSGRVATVDANLKLSSAVTDRLRLNAAYTYNDRDNKTPQSLYQVFTTDMFAGAARTNLPYSFTQDKLKLSADYRASARLRGSVGLDHDAHKRSFQEVATTREDTVWGKISNRTLDNLDLTFKLAHGERRNSGYQVVAGVIPPALENPLLRKYNLANRTRDSAAMRADIAASETVNVGFGADWSRDAYTDSSIGLNSGSDFNLNGDISVMLAPQTSLHFFANHEEIESKQFGSQAFATADWTGQNKDRIDLAGVGLKHNLIENKLDVGADYAYTRSKTEIIVNNGLFGPSFPNLSTTLNSLKLYATYRLKDNVSLQGGYWYERYDSRDWMLDGVAPNTIPNVLGLGLQPPQYRVNVIRLSVRYKF